MKSNPIQCLFVFQILCVCCICSLVKSFFFSSSLVRYRYRHNSDYFTRKKETHNGKSCIQITKCSLLSLNYSIFLSGINRIRIKFNVGSIINPKSKYFKFRPKGQKTTWVKFELKFDTHH